jgi:hypothetical protein
MMPMMPPGVPPEDMQKFLDDQQRLAARNQAIQLWYDAQMARLESEHRERVVRFGAILCRCMSHEPCQVHGNILVTNDGRVL